MIPPTAADLIAAMAAHGYAVFDGVYDLNLIALRAVPGVPNRFDDLMVILYHVAETPEWQVDAFSCTTDPGTYYLLNPIHPSGTAQLAPAQNHQAFTFGLHHGAYECLVQRGPVAAYLDANRNAVTEPGTVHQLGPECGIHVHHAAADHRSTVVDQWSAGCQVLADPGDFARFMALCHKQVAHGKGDRFTLTVLEWAA